MAKKMISLEISDELREALRVEAFKRNKTLSATMREILEEALHVDSQKETKDGQE